MEKFNEFLARRDEGLFDGLFGGGKPKPNAASRRPAPQMNTPDEHLPMAHSMDPAEELVHQFGSKRIRGGSAWNGPAVDDHLLQAVAAAYAHGDRDSVYAALQAIEQTRAGRHAAAAIQQFMGQGAGAVNKGRQQAAQGFAVRGESVKGKRTNR